MPTKYGDQPIVQVVRDRGWSYGRLALAAGLTYKQLYAAARGVITPGRTAREQLPQILGMPLADLFTADSLAATPNPHVGPGNRSVVA